MPQLERNPCTATKTQHSKKQINIKKRERERRVFQRAVDVGLERRWSREDLLRRRKLCSVHLGTSQPRGLRTPVLAGWFWELGEPLLQGRELNQYPAVGRKERGFLHSVNLEVLWAQLFRVFARSY